MGGGGKLWWNLNSGAFFFFFCPFSQGQSTSKMPLESNQILKPRFSDYKTSPNPLGWGSWLCLKSKPLQVVLLHLNIYKYFLRRCVYLVLGHGLKDSRWIPLWMVSLTFCCPWRCEDACANPWAGQAARWISSYYRLQVTLWHLVKCRKFICSLLPFGFKLVHQLALPKEPQAS